MHALLIPSSATALSLSQAGIASSYDESINSAYQINSKNPKYFSFGMNNWYGDLKGTKIQYRWLNKSSNSIKVNLWEITDLELRDTIPSVLPLGEFGAQFSSINYNFEAVNGNIYIIGISKNKKELKKVVSHANDIKGVLKVVSHAIMKDDPRRIKYQRKLQKKND